jgi:hypothetical protein
MVQMVLRDQLEQLALVLVLQDQLELLDQLVPMVHLD